MALFQGTVRSQALDMDTRVHVIIPRDYYDAQGQPKRTVDKVLYLLHGLRQSGDAWLHLSNAERYARYHGCALVIPEVQRSWYCDLPNGMRYFTYITEELPRLMRDMFRLPDDRESTYIGGLSMGGYGALKCVLRHPERYAGALCFSGAFYTIASPEGRAYCGLSDAPLPPEDDIARLIAAFPADAPRPRLYLACGTEDFLFQDNLRCRDALAAAGFNPTWEAWSGGHDWIFWDAALQKAMTLIDTPD